MNDQLFQREKKIDDYIHDTSDNTLQNLRRQENKGLGNAPQQFKNSQQLINEHQDGMNSYARMYQRKDLEHSLVGDDEIDEEMQGIIDYQMRIEQPAPAFFLQAVKNQEQYYFRRSERTFAKGERFKRLSKNTEALRAHASVHKNRSANKRAKKAKEASKAYNKVARMQAAYETDLENRNLTRRSMDDATRGGFRTESGRFNWHAESYADYTRLEEITRARIEALTLAAQTKSISRKQENYSIQKGTLKNLLILQDSLNKLVEQKEGTEDGKLLKAKQADLAKEIAATSKKVDSYVPHEN